MRMKINIAMAVLAVGVVLLIAQDSNQVATVNGQPVIVRTISDTQASCQQIKAHVMKAARDLVQQQYAVAVSPDEVNNAAKEQLAKHDPATELQKERTKWATYSLAAAQVYDQHQDPEKVYQSLIAPLDRPGDLPEISHKVWEANLKTWSTPEGRAALAKRVANTQSWTPESMRQAMVKSTEDYLLSQKLDEDVDAQLASQDPKFRSDLENYQAHQVKRGAFAGSRLAPSDYMQAKRAEFWQSRYAAQQVTLNDPTLASQCNLGSMGVVAAR